MTALAERAVEEMRILPSRVISKARRKEVMARAHERRNMLSQTERTLKEADPPFWKVQKMVVAPVKIYMDMRNGSGILGNSSGGGW